MATDSSSDQQQQDLFLPGLTRRATIGDPVYDKTLTKQKRKAVAVACERCRRRKIRCDGFQPCATCARFAVRCVRAEERRERSCSTTETAAALALRVRQLEARLAASGQSLPPSSEQSLPSSSGQILPPALHLQTNFDDISSLFPFEDNIHSGTPMDGTMSLSVPAIQVTGPHGGESSSPFLSPNSPSPSLYSGTSRASTPDPCSATSWYLHTDSQIFTRTPPMTEWADLSTALLTTPDASHSRRSSVSSFSGLGPSFCSMDLDGAPSPSPQEWTTDPSPMEFPPWNPEQQQQPFHSIPSRQHAETLAEHAFTHRRVPLERTAFRICLDAVYEDAPTATQSSISRTNLSSLTRHSLRTAKAVVFLVLAIGAKSQIRAGEDADVSSMCYAVVHEQMRGLDFWAEAGSKDVVRLMALLSEICTL